MRTQPFDLYHDIAIIIRSLPGHEYWLLAIGCRVERFITPTTLTTYRNHRSRLYGIRTCHTPERQVRSNYRVSRNGYPEAVS